jgi:2-dehydropantoate 2-reductase
MRVLIMGAGGLGSVVGGYLAHTGVDVTLVARPAHAQAIREKGLKITGVRGEFLIKDNLIAIDDPTQAQGEFDYFALMTKAKDSETALKQCDPLKDRIHCVFSFQNAMGKEEILARWIGREKVIGAATIEGATLMEPGVCINPLTTPTTAYFGELDGKITPRVETITDAFNKAGFGTKAVSNIMQVLWEKLVQIGNASGWSVTTLAALDSLYFADGLCVREGAEHYVQIAKELLSIYRGLGFTPQNFFAPMSRLKEMDAMSFEEAVQAMMAQGKELKEKGLVRGRTSMHEDVLRRKKTEVDYIIKPFLEQSKALNIPIPTVTAVYRIIKTIDTYLQ